jgi:hypothetical protein
MKMNDIQESIGQIWSSILPSVIRTGIMTFVFFLFVPFSEFANLVQPSLENGVKYLSQQDVQATLTFYGLDKLMPFLVLFIFLLIISITDRLIFVFSPLWFMDVNLLEHNIFIKTVFSGDLGFIWAEYPTIENDSELEYQIDYLVTKENPVVKQVSGVDYWFTKKNESYDILEYLKFLNLWFIVIGIIATAKGYLYFGLFIAYLIFFFFIQYLVISYVFFQRRKYIVWLSKEKVRIAKSFVMSNSPKFDESKVDEFTDKIDETRSHLPKSDVELFFFGLSQKRWAHHIQMRLLKGKEYKPRQKDYFQLFLVNVVMRIVDLVRPIIPARKSSTSSSVKKKRF